MAYLLATFICACVGVSNALTPPVIARVIVFAWGRRLVVFSMLLLSGCGGGGGGGGGNAPSGSVSADSNADGLGITGLAPGTTVIGSDTTGLPYTPEGRVSVALADDGYALAVWTMHAASYVDYTAAWNQTDPSGSWGSQQSLPQVNGTDYQYSSLQLRMNASGNAVLGWVSPNQNNRAARFIKGTGWDTTSYDASGGTSIYALTNPNSWDVTLLADNSFATSTHDWSGGYLFKVLRQPISGSSILSLDTPADTGLVVYAYSYLATRPTGDGVLAWVAGSSASQSQVDIRARLVSVYSGGFAPFTIATYPRVCPTTGYGFDSAFNPLIAATSPTFFSTLAVVVQDSAASPISCLVQDLELIRLDTSGGISIRTTRVNSADTAITAAPKLVMDQSGNALAVWKESSGTGIAQTQLMWSASLQGGAWSTPQPVISNLSAIGVVPRGGEISLAMNDNGQAVAALVTHDADPTIANPSVSYGRFSFASGWTTWTRIANKTNISDPKVAINQSGNAIIVYSALDLNRVGGRAPGSFSAPIPTTNIYSFRL